MQISAFDEKGALITVTCAKRGVDYICFECQGALRLRGGKQTQLHFYHLRFSPDCRQSNKSATHLALQHHLENLLPQGECTLEKHFKGRIADCFWEREKIVFEIQCSPLSQVEAKERMADYEKLGLKTVWILHDTTFNRRYKTPLETFLEEHTHYYTNFSPAKGGIIYDQLSLYKGTLRTLRTPPLAIDVRRPQRRVCPLRKKWSLHFAGDVSHSRNDPYVQSIVGAKNSFPLWLAALWRGVRRGPW